MKLALHINILKPLIQYIFYTHSLGTYDLVLLPDYGKRVTETDRQLYSKTPSDDR